MLSLGLIATMASRSAAQRDEEPPLEFILRIDGADVPITAGKPATVTVAGKEVEVTLTPRPERRFSAAGLAFSYPAGHSFEVDREVPGLTIWTFDGNDNVIMIQRAERGIEPEDLARQLLDGLAEQFDAEGEPQRVTRRFDGRDVAGRRAVFKVADARISYEIFPLSVGGAAVALMIQDSPEDDGSPTEETRQVIALLERTLKVTE